MEVCRSHRNCHRSEVVQKGLGWKPAGVRLVGGQFRRWSDCIEKLTGADWMVSAMDTDVWLLAEHRYVYRDDADELFGKRWQEVAITLGKTSAEEDPPLGSDGRGGPTLPSGRREPHHRGLSGRWESHT